MLIEPVPIVFSAAVSVLSIPLYRRIAKRRLHLNVALLKAPRVSVLREMVLFLAGWGLSLLEFLNGSLLAGWFVLLLCVELICGRAASSTFPGTISFLDRLENDVSGGADFFSALAAATPSLSEPRERRAAVRCLQNFSERRSLQDCLKPLFGAGACLETLAAEVLQTGWAHSSALSLSISQLRIRTAGSWRKRQQRRLWGVRMARHLPALLTLSAGAGMAWIMKHPLPLQTWWQTAGGILLLYTFRMEKNAFKRRTLGAAVLLVWLLPSHLPYAAVDVSDRETEPPHALFRGKDFRRAQDTVMPVIAVKPVAPVDVIEPPSTAVIWNRVGTGAYLWERPGEGILAFLMNGAWVELTDVWREKGLVPFGEVVTSEGVHGWVDMTNAHRMMVPDETLRYVGPDRGAYLYDAPQGRLLGLLTPGTPVFVRPHHESDRIIPVETLVGRDRGWISSEHLAP